jgi:hypothetical protein
MNDDDTMTAVRNSLTDVKESLSDVRMGRSADTIRARARGRRLRRGLSAAGAGTLALGIGLTLALSPAGGASARPAVAGARSVHVNLDAWSVNTTSTGIVDLTIQELFDPAQLRTVLAQAGVPAVVKLGQVCTGKWTVPQATQVLRGHRTSTGAIIESINPAAMPRGSEVVIGILPPASVVEVGLAKDGASLTCPAPPRPAKPTGSIAQTMPLERVGCAIDTFSAGVVAGGWQDCSHER